MKMHTMHNGTKNSKLMLLLLVALNLCLSSFSQTVSAEPVFETASVKHFTVSGEKIGFRAQLHNAGGEKFSVAIKDETGLLLFYDEYTDKNFDKRFIFETTKDLGLRFVFKRVKSKESQTFKVSTTTTFFDDYTVSLKNR